jgi:hypothetical protein
MSATVATTTVESATTVDATAAVGCATADATADRYVRRATAESANCTATPETRTATGKSATVEAAPETTSTEAGTPIEAAAEPRAGTDEEAAREPARTVVAIRRAGIRVISIVAVGARGGRTDVSWADAHAHHHALGASIRCQGKGSSKYRKNHQIFHKMFHFWAPSEPVNPFNL